MNQTADYSPSEKVRYWTRVILRARGHAPGIRRYCAKEDIPLNSYYYWFKRLRVQHPEWEDLPKHPDDDSKSNGAEPQSVPETEVVAKATRRTFSAAYKAKILREVDAAEPGKIGAILRREGLYSSHIQKWRAEDKKKPEAAKRGPKANPLAAEVKRQREQIARLEKRLAKAGHIIELQKKIAEIIGVTLDEIPDDE